jgi:hypothetical protein
LTCFVSYFSSELLAELWARAERARGNLAELKPDASWHDVYNVCIGLASLIPVPGAAAAFIASCKIGEMVMSAIDAYESFKDSPAGEVLLQLKDTVMGVKEWKEQLDAVRGVGSAGAVDSTAAAASGSGALPACFYCCFITGMIIANAIAYLQKARLILKP